MNLKHFIKELQRRNVIKSALAYIVFSWIVIQVFSILLPTFDAPPYVMKIIFAVLVIGFVLWLVYAWVYEITPEGIKKTVNVSPETSITPQTSNRLNKIIIGALGIAIVLLIFNAVSNKTAAPITDSETPTDSIASKDKSIAVLAFADMSPEKDQEYFSDGISEEILNLLAKIPDLKVISRTSSFSFKGKEATTAEIGKTLNVTHILEGSIRKSGNTFRITAQLINVANGAHIWSETYDREMSDIFKIQDEIAGKVTQELKTTLLVKITHSKTANTEAYNLYLQAKQLEVQRTLESNKNAEQLIKASIAIDSTYAPAWALYSAVVYRNFSNFLTLSIKEGIKKGKPKAEKAIKLDPSHAVSYGILADYNRYEWDFESAAKNSKKALEIAPENSEVLRKTALNALDFGKLPEAITLTKKAIELDPLNYIYHFSQSLNYAWSERYDEAEASLKKYIMMYPDAGFAHSFMAQILSAKGDYKAALNEVEKDNDVFFKLYRKSMVVYAAGDKKQADGLLKQLIADWGDLAWPNIASVYAFRGEKDAAFKWLDLAYDQRDGSTLEILNYPEMKNLWGDPRWNKFINKLGLPKDHEFHRD